MSRFTEILNAYVPQKLQAEFLEANKAILANVSKTALELAQEEVELLAKTALRHLGIEGANTPHVTSVAPEDLPPAVPTILAPVDAPVAPTVVVSFADTPVDAPVVIDVPAVTVVANPNERIQTEPNARIAELEAELAQLKNAPSQVSV